jgi:hypothetical protein
MVAKLVREALGEELVRRVGLPERRRDAHDRAQLWVSVPYTGFSTFRAEPHAFHAFQKQRAALAARLGELAEPQRFLF